MNYDVIVVGAGAAGMMCAAEAGKRGRRVVLLEHNDKPGKKIRISGGGRCNFTNINAQPHNYLSQNPHFCKSALARYTPADFLALVEQHGIAWHEKKLGQLFCDGSAQHIIDMLVHECHSAGVELRLHCGVTSVEQRGEEFVAHTPQGSIAAQSLVVATGGLSIPPLGATDIAYRIARQFGVQVVAPRPGLVPLTLRGRHAEIFRQLSGVSLDVVASCNGVAFRENVLFTHKGISGPAVLQVSSYWKPGDAVTLHILPDVPVEEWLTEQRASKKEIHTVLSQFLPKSFAQNWCTAHHVTGSLNQLSTATLQELVQLLTQWSILPDGTEGYAKAEVTLGGVSTSELSSKTMEVRAVAGLYFIGEAVDVTGWLGGYNFQWAWSSGYVAGQCV